MKGIKIILMVMSVMLFSTAKANGNTQLDTYRDVIFAQAPTANGGSKDLKLNIYKGKGVVPQPVVLFVHGGAWVSGDNNIEGSGSEQIRAIMQLREKGVTIAAPTYRFSNEAIFPAQIHDIKAAIRYLKANAKKYGIDPNRIMTMGESAGSQLALLAAVSNGEDAMEGTIGGNINVDSKVTGCVDCYGMTDFLTLASDLYARPDLGRTDKQVYELVEDKNSSRSQLFGLTTDECNLGTVTANPDKFPEQYALVKSGSPIYHVTPDDPPILIINGQRDIRVPSAQAMKMYQALYDAGVEAELLLNDRAPHGDLGKESAVAIQSFIMRILRPEVYYKPVNSKSTASTRALLERLYTTVEEGKIFSGLHHNQLHMPNYTKDLNRIDEAVKGAVPMVWGGDLAWDADKVVNLSIDHHKKGYLISMTWHAARPFDRGPVNFRQQTQGKFTKEQWAELVTEGTEMNKLWLEQVDSIAQYLKVLQENDVPVLWRPFHEMNGEWFWWGDRRGENGFTVLWKMLYHRLTDYHGLNNLIWVWNPNNPRKHPVDKQMGYELYYPGDEYVDVLAADVYHREWFQDTHDQLVELGKGKVLALGEVGELPSAEQLKNYNRYAWFMIWTDFTFDKYNTIDALREIFSDKRVINLQPKP